MSEIQNELISVILPVYNVEQYLNECINSLLLQTYSNLEIILVDDGSTDGSGKVCDEWKYKDKRIRVIHKKNEGVSVARNIGIDASTGKYIGFIDSDDAVAPEFYEKLYHAIMAESADLAVTHEIIWDGGQIQKTACTSQNGKGECLEGKKEFLEHFLEPFTGNIGWVWNKLYSRDLIGSSRFIRVKNMEDVMFNAEIALKVKHAVWICDRLYYYRQREGSVCGCGKNNRILEEMNGQKYIHQLFMNESDDFGKRYTAYVLNHMADAWSKSRRSRFSDEKEVRAVFVDYYDRYHKYIRGMSEGKKAFMARYAKDVYCFYKNMKVNRSGW